MRRSGDERKVGHAMPQYYSRRSLVVVHQLNRFGHHSVSSFFLHVQVSRSSLHPRTHTHIIIFPKAHASNISIQFPFISCLQQISSIYEKSIKFHNPAYYFYQGRDFNKAPYFLEYIVAIV